MRSSRSCDGINLYEERFRHKSIKMDCFTHRFVLSLGCVPNLGCVVSDSHSLFPTLLGGMNSAESNKRCTHKHQAIYVKIEDIP